MSAKTNQISNVWIEPLDQEKFRPLETLASKEAEIKERIDNLLNYTIEEVKNIKKLMDIVWEIDYLISSWKNISNSIQYNKFFTWYKLLSEKEKKHFNEIYKEFRIIYYYEKIVSNIKQKHSSSLWNITWYLNQFKTEDFDNKYISKFWSFFSKEEREFILEHFEQK